jgi:hypothetical protein
MSTKCDELVNSYVEWLRDRIAVNDVDGVCQITTPFLDRHNDCLQIYVVPSDGGFRLTDDGYVLADLESSGFVLNTPKRRDLLRSILNGYGVQEQDGELFIESSSERFPQKKHSLLQAMIAVNDMFMTAAPHVATLFVQDVEHFLEEHEVRFSPNVEFTGKTGFVHKFDFVIPRSRTAPERLVRAINRPERNTATSLLFSWTDTKGVRPKESKFYVLLNDAEKPVNVDLIDAFKHYEVEPVLWSQREKYSSALVA